MKSDVILFANVVFKECIGPLPCMKTSRPQRLTMLFTILVPSHIRVMKNLIVMMIVKSKIT